MPHFRIASSLAGRHELTVPANHGEGPPHPFCTSYSSESPVMATERYNPRASEPKWQKAWDEAKLFETKNDDPRPKYYVLEMFPYPSGRIHMGHVRNYTMGDVVARYRRAMGYNVLHPMGWDAFGLPAENAARDNKVNPRDWTYANIATMKGQLKTMGLSLDWAREIATCDPSYYKHQQKLFLDFWKAGLVERKSAKVNWDPVDMTVLANEQVIDGRGWRSGALVEQRDLTQWFFKITVDVAGAARQPRHARPLAGKGPADAGELDRPLRGPADPLAARPRHGAGGRERARSLHDAARHDLRRVLHGDRRRPSAGQEGGREQSRSSPPSSTRSATWAPRLAALETAEKKGFDTGIRVVHPFDPSWTLPVYVANFVLMDYGTGAIFGCPSGDQRDLDFANKYGLPVVPVVMPEGADATTFQIIDEAYVDDGVMINSRFLDGMKPKRGLRGSRRPAGRRHHRQPADGRAQGAVPPARLADLAPALLGLPDPGDPLRRLRRGAGAGQRAAGRAARRRDLRQAGQSARPPSDLEACRLPAMRQGRRGATPTRWTRSSIRPGISRASPIRGTRPRRRRSSCVDGKSGWLPVNQYIGGIEHAILHLLYSRFFVRAMKVDRPSERRRRAVRGPVHARHGRARDLQGSGRLGDAGRGQGRGGRRHAPGVAARRRRRRSRSARSRRCRSRRRTSSTPTTSSPATAPTRRAGSCCRIRRPSAT